MSPTPFRVRAVGAALACWIGGSSAAAQDALRLPGPELNLNLSAPITTWDEVVPLGNGAMGVLRVGDNYELTLKPGEVVEATLPKPKQIPPAPANAAEPMLVGQSSASTPDKFPATPWSATQLSRLRQALESWHPRYDPAERMIRRPFSSPGYHTALKGGEVHPTRDALNYAVALLDTGEPALLQRAEDILRRVLALQDQDPESKTYGIWSWFLEEPLDQMAPPDWNWADFCGVQLLQVALDHRRRLAPDLAAEVDAAIQHAARSIRRRNVGPGYTNIAIMGAYVTLVAAELYRLEDLREYARNRWRAFHAFTRRSGAFSEYNSPTYTVVALKELGRMRQHVRDAEMRRLVEEVYRFAWEEIAHHFHAPTRQWAGPHSRAYHTLLPADVLALLERSTEGRLAFATGEPAPALDEHRVPTPCPRDLEPFFMALLAPREVVKTFVPGEPPVTGTTFLHPQFALGSINRGDLWNQRRALLAYWGTAEAPSYLHLRCLRDGYDFAAAQFFSVQRGSDLLAGVNFATDGGDTHVSLDRLQNATVRARDLRLRFEFGGAAGGRSLPTPARLEDPLTLRWGEVRLDLSVPYARFGDAVGRWETGQDASKRLAWLDVVLYAGEHADIRLDQLEQAVAGLAVRFSDRDEAGPAVQAVVAEGRLALALESPGLRLTLPVRPGKAGALQTGFTVAVHP